MERKKSKLVSYLLAFFLGGIGAHLFYIGKWKRGIVYLIFCWTYIPIFLGWIDMFFINKWLNQRPKEVSRIISPMEKNVKAKYESRIEPTPNSHTYSPENIILSKYAHLKTPQYILDFLQGSKANRKKNSGASIVISISTNYTDFVKDSLKYANTKGALARHKPLFAYWTTFKDLNIAQRQWYFYWRERVLNGEYPDTDLSYIILFTFELINYTFNDNAAFNVSMMERLYENYKERDPKIKNYLPNWICDFLTELGEEELAKAWGNADKNWDDSLYEKIIGNQSRIDKISITVWKQYLKSYKETEFFWGNKSKIYDTFKQGAALLNDIYKSQGSNLAERWFEKEEKTQDMHMYGSAVVGRNVRTINKKYFIHHPLKRMYDEINALFRISENVVRFIIGEKRELKVQSELLPDNFRELLIQKLQSKKPDKKVKDRFKLVQEAGEKEGFVSIPAQPEEKQEKIITFNMSEIETLSKQSEELQNTFKENGYEDEEMDQDSFKETAVEKMEVIEGSEGEKATNNFTFTFDSKEEVDEFIDSLTNIEYKYLVSFEDLKRSVSESNTYFKSNGMMAGTFISSINEKANEYLDDNLIEMNGDYYVIYEDYEDIISRIKKGEINEH